MSDGARWGQSQWGDAQWGSSEVGVSHNLATRVGMVVDASALRLGANHRLETLAHTRTIAVGAGMGPAPIHPMLPGMMNPAIMAVDAAAVALRKQHLLETLAALTTEASALSLKMGHKLVSVAELDIDATGRLRIFHPLETTVSLAMSAEAAGLTNGHPLETFVGMEIITVGRYTIEIPELLPPDVVNPDDPNSVVPGTVNLVLNPSAETDLTGWSEVGDVLLSRVEDVTWDRTTAVLVDPEGLFAGEGVNVRTAFPLGLAPQGGAVLWGQAAVSVEDSDAPVTIVGWLQVHYVDDSLDAGDVSAEIEVVSDGLEGDWLKILVPALTLDGDKVVELVRIFLVTAGAASVPFRVGGVQIEYDRWMMGPTPIRTDVMVLESDVAV